MPALTREEFKALAQQYPGLGETELFAIANLHNDLKAKTFTPSPVPAPPTVDVDNPTTGQTVGRTAARVVPAVLGGVLGAPFGPVGMAAGGAIGSGLGELGAEYLESRPGAGQTRDRINPAQVAMQTALGAIPVPGATTASVGGRVLSAAGKGAVMGGVSSAATDLAEGQAPTLKGVATGAALGGVLGGAAHGATELPWAKLLADESGQLTLPGGAPAPPPISNLPKGFYSRVDRLLEQIPAKGVHPNKLKSMLQSGAAKEEVELRKIPEFLASLGEKPVTREAFEAHLRANPMNVELSRYGRRPEIEIDPSKITTEELGKNPIFPHGSQQVYYDGKPVMQRRPNMDQGAPSWDPIDPDDVARLLGNRAYKQPKYTDWSLPGGHAKEETLITVPAADLKADIGDPVLANGTGTLNYEGRHRVEGAMEFPFKIGAEEGTITYWPKTFDWDGKENPPKYIINSPNVQNARMDSLEDARAYLEHTANDPEGYKPVRRNDVFIDHHYARELNPVGHSRSDTRFDPKGNRGHLIDEVQSFAHQAARDKGGYRVPNYDDLVKSYEAAKQRYADAIRDDADDAVLKVLKNRHDELAGQVSRNYNRPVDLPFKQSWPELVLKQQVLDAVDDDAKFLAMSTGDIQNERYGLEKKFSRIAYHPNTGNLQAWDKRGKLLFSNKVAPEEVGGTVGRELAQKLKESERLGAIGIPVQELIGDDLKTGGEPMRKFYDEGNVRRLEKILGTKGELKKIETTPKKVNTDISWHQPFEDMQMPQGFYATPRGRGKPKQIASFWSPTGANGPYVEQNIMDDQWDDLGRVEKVLQKQAEDRAGFKTKNVWKFNLTPEIKARIKKEGLPILTLLGMLGLGTGEEKEQDSNPALSKALLAK